MTARVLGTSFFQHNGGERYWQGQTTENQTIKVICAIIINCFIQKARQCVSTKNFNPRKSIDKCKFYAVYSGYRMENGMDETKTKGTQEIGLIIQVRNNEDLH